MNEKFFGGMSENERILQLDVIRGLALLGVLLVNIDVFSGAFWAIEAGIPYPMGWGGKALAGIRGALIEGKAVALFSLLFGAGLMIQMERARTQGRNFTSFALRRLGILAAIGLLHSFLLWDGDILVDYAILGLWVLPFLRFRPSRVLWAIPLLLVISLLVSLPFMPMLERLEQRTLQIYELGMRHYGQSSWLEALKYRSWEMIHIAGPLRLESRLAFCAPFFILGIYFWKKGFFPRPEENRQKLRRFLMVCTPIGLAANILSQDWFFGWVNRLPVRMVRVMIKMTYVFGKPLLALAYATGLLLLLTTPGWRRRLAIFAPLGKTALTQYLLQSVVCSLIFYGFGLGLYGKLPMNACILGGIIFFFLQVWLGSVWLKYFRMGPVEWLWRGLSYRRWLPFRRNSPQISTLSPKGQK